MQKYKKKTITWGGVEFPRILDDPKLSKEGITWEDRDGLFNSSGRFSRNFKWAF